MLYSRTVGVILQCWALDMYIASHDQILGCWQVRTMLIEYGQKNICLWSWEELSFIVGLCFSGNICIDMFCLYEMVMVADDSGGMRVNFNISTWKELEVMLVLFL